MSLKDCSVLSHLDNLSRAARGSGLLSISSQEFFKKSAIWLVYPFVHFLRTQTSVRYIEYKACQGEKLQYFSLCKLVSLSKN